MENKNKTLIELAMYKRSSGSNIMKLVNGTGDAQLLGGTGNNIPPLQKKVIPHITHDAVGQRVNLDKGAPPNSPHVKPKFSPSSDASAQSFTASNDYAHPTPSVTRADPTKEKTPTEINPSTEQSANTEEKKPLSDRDVLAHTASLWQYKPVPKDEPEPYSEDTQESATIGCYHVTAGRVRGKKHKHEGTNCDDWFETFGVDEFVVVLVSDGAGSKKYSRIGAKVSCESAKEFLTRGLPQMVREEIDFFAAIAKDVNAPQFQNAAARLAKTAQEAVRVARKAVETAFDIRKKDAKYSELLGRDLALADFAATFLLTIAIPLEKDRETLAVTIQVGDGLIVGLNTRGAYDGAVTLLCQPDSGAFAGETEFLVSPGVDSDNSLMARTRISRKPFDFIMAMTDGVADDYDPPEAQIPRLYFDLKANRIIESPELTEKLQRIEDKRFELNKKVPEPVKYPPNNFPVQYTDALCKVCNVTLKDLWEDNVGYLAVMTSSIKMGKEDVGARLVKWLDSYVIRGSFDDRTLVILQRGDS
ncbi:MAG: protein phosphatase 2C domain-containing protein [Selenomonadaceae bacterium]|nr:protein phosphatase 2C domain-containing protein [Selenomonadaceae bacterium]